MVILGAGGHAKEILDIFLLSSKHPEVTFFDNMPKEEYWPESLGYKVIKSTEALQETLSKNPHFILGVGSPKSRMLLYQLATKYGGVASSIVSPNAQISENSAKIGLGVNVMQYVFLSANTFIGKGVLLNMRCAIHHDCIIEDFCEISPGAIILGGAKIMQQTFVGAGAIVLPQVSIGSNSIIGAGALVNRDIPSNSLAVGVPVRILEQK